MNFRILAGIVIAAMCLTLTGSAQIWDAGGGFSSTQNPNGIWTYGWSSALNTALVTYSGTSENYSSETWIDPTIATMGAPFIGFNWHPSSMGPIPPYSMSVQPGPQGQFSHCLWTAPTSGTYSISVAFTGASIGKPHAYVLENGVSIADSPISNSSTWSQGFNSVTLNAGDTVDAVVGVSPGDSYLFEQTGLTFRITNSDYQTPVDTAVIPGRYLSVTSSTTGEMGIVSGKVDASGTFTGTYRVGSNNSVMSGTFDQTGAFAGAEGADVVALKFDSQGFLTGTAYDGVNNGFSTSPALSAMTSDAASDFSPPLNGVASWTYGSEADPASIFVADPSTTADVFGPFSVPLWDSPYSVVRWTAPASGIYEVSINANLISTGNGLIPSVYIEHNGMIINNYAFVSDYTGADWWTDYGGLAISAGDTLDLVVNTWDEANMTISPITTPPGAPVLPGAYRVIVPGINDINGLVAATVDAAGNITGSLDFYGIDIPLSGAFDASGHYSRRELSALGSRDTMLSLQFDGNGNLNGSLNVVSDASGHFSASVGIFPFVGDSESSLKIWDARLDNLGMIATSGTWAYGWSSDLAGETFTTDPSAVVYNNYTFPVSGALPNEIYMTPGGENQFARCRWTTPEAGLYRIQASFTPVSNGNPHAYIILNGTSIADSVLTQIEDPATGIYYGDWTYAGDAVQLNPGDTVEAVLGVGVDNVPVNDIAGFGLTISETSGTSSVATSAGTYQALLSSTSSTVAAGLIRLTATKSSAFSAVVDLGGTRIPFAGQFSKNGVFSSAVIGKNRHDSIQMRMDERSHLAGIYTSGSANYSFTSSPLIPADHYTAGRYSFSISPRKSASPGLAPEGDGYGIMKVYKNGAVALTGRLANGTPFSASSALTGGKVAAIYSHGGAISGYISFTNASGVEHGAGGLTRVQPPATGTPYARGFQLVAYFAAESAPSTLSSNQSARFKATMSTPLFPLLSTATLTRKGDSLTGKVANLKLTVNRISELFTGTFQDESDTTHSFYGAVLPGSRTGYGYFLNGGFSGTVEFNY